MGIVVRDEGKKVNSDINVTPMVDVMLVLLIIFMLVTPMLQNKVNVDLAKTQSAVPLPDADHEDSVKVAVTRDGKVYLGANQVSLADLGPKAQDLLQNKPDKTVTSARTHGRDMASSWMRSTIFAPRASTRQRF
jgi:biopolymer transport protein TolR